MEFVIILIISILLIITLGILFDYNRKKIKSLGKNEKLDNIAKKYPSNIEICKYILKKLNNESVKIEENKDTEASLYIAITNKISIANISKSYTRIQTIAHECLHSIQDKRLLLFNFIFSNIIIVYWLTISILTATHVITNISPFAFALVLMAMVKLAVRGFLETDAMTKARYLAEKYIDNKKILNKNEKEKLLAKYDKINALGVPFTIVYIMLGSLLGIFVFGLIALIV